MAHAKNTLLELASHIPVGYSSVQTAVVVGLWSVGTLIT